MNRLCTLLCVVAVVSTGAATADADWVTDYFMTGLDGEVVALLEYEGDLVLGGDFQAAGPLVARHVVRYDGADFHPLGEGLTGTVLALAAWDGALVAATGQAGDLRRVWVWDGSAWSPLGPELPTAQHALTAFDDQLFCGPLRWDGATWQDVLGVDGTVADLVVHGGALVFGGDFTTAGDGGVPGPIAVWDGTQVTAGYGGLPHAVRELASGDAGLSALTDTPLVHELAAHAWNGAGWDQLGDVLRWNFAHLTDDHGVLRLAGHWSGIEGILYSALLRYEAGEWRAGGGVCFPGTMLPWGGGLVVATRGGGGWWTLVDGFPCHGAVFIGDNGMQPLGPLGGAPSGPVTSIHAGSQLAVAGAFRWAAGVETDGLLVRHDGQWEGRIVNGWNALAPAAMATLGDDLVVSYEEPWNYHPGEPALVRWSPAGDQLGVWYGFADYRCLIAVPVLDDILVGVSESAMGDLAFYDGEPRESMYYTTNGAFNLVMYDPPSSLYAAGNFAAVDGVPAGSIAMIPPGSGDLDGGVDDEVFALARHQDLLVAGGRFTHAGGSPAQHIAGWDGDAWVPLGEGMDGWVRCLVSDGEQLFAGGEFTTAGGRPAAHLAVWNDGAWHPVGAGCDGPVLALAIHEGRLWIGGEFRSAGGTPAWNLSSVDLATLVAAPEPALPAAVVLSAPSPNPFNPRTDIAFTLSAAGRVRLLAFDLAGRRVATIIDGPREAGEHRAVWTGADQAGRPLPSGVYLLRLETGGVTATRTATLVR